MRSICEYQHWTSVRLRKGRRQLLDKDNRTIIISLLQSFSGYVSESLCCGCGRGTVCEDSSSLASSGEHVLSLASPDCLLWVYNSLQRRKEDTEE